MPTSKTKTTKKPAAKVVVMPAPMATAPMPVAAVVAPVAPVSNVIPMPKKPVAKKPVAKKPVAKAPVKMKAAAASVRPAKKVARKKK